MRARATRYILIYGSPILSDALQPLASRDGDPIFTAAWQAEILGIADLLVKADYFSAALWAQTLGHELKNHPDTTDGYYTAVLKSVETLLATSGVSPSELSSMRKAWESAYRKTPHGQPVSLD